jgi:hypothetical protein
MLVDCWFASRCIDGATSFSWFVLLSGHASFFLRLFLFVGFPLSLSLLETDERLFLSVDCWFASRRCCNFFQLGRGMHLSSFVSFFSLVFRSHCLSLKRTSGYFCRLIVGSMVCSRYVTSTHYYIYFFFPTCSNIVVSFIVVCLDFLYCLF